MTDSQTATRVLLAGASATVGVGLAFVAAGLLKSVGLTLLGKSAFALVLVVPFVGDRAYMNHIRSKHHHDQTLAPQERAQQAVQGDGPASGGPAP